ncbi:MAG: M23 family metallopeptidase [Firmicutes bacterium]|nr:M23 family metallopeptidase [[Eubacterium] siraeum]MCM1486978.1 M23 family metallopeptidase [Bacillota bacterium]
MKKQPYAKIRAALKGKGFIIALALSLGAVGFSTYYAYNSIMSNFNEDPENDSLFMEVDKNQSGIPKDTSAAVTSPASETTAAAASTSAASETTPAASGAGSFFTSKAPRQMPIEGEIINGYSDGELVKSETLNLWQTHDGVDIAAEEGAQVKAAAEGAVLNIWEDPLWGVSLSIDHGDGYISTYCGLDQNLSAAIGQEIACGDIIGTVGRLPDCECSLSPHLHFEVKKDGSYVDPIAFAEGN